MNELAHVISGCTQMPVHLATARVSAIICLVDTVMWASRTLSQ